MQIGDVKTIVEGLLKELTVDVSRIEVVACDPHPLLSVVTPDSGILIGVQGENLRALNYLVKKVVATKAIREGKEKYCRPPKSGLKIAATQVRPGNYKGHQRSGNRHHKGEPGTGLP